MGDVPARRLSSERGRHKAVCQQRRWASQGVDTRRSANEGVRIQRGGLGKVDTRL